MKNKIIRIIAVLLVCFIFQTTLLTVTASAAPSNLPSSGREVFYTASIATMRPVPLTITTGTGIDEVDNMFAAIMNILYGLCRFAGAAALLWGIVQIGMSISSHDNGQKVNGFLFAGAGVLILFAPNIIQALSTTA